ncbi:UNVERIFIED_ORG: hypothetical protein GGR78_001961, partial [Xanthomonas campestris]
VSTTIGNDLGSNGGPRRLSTPRLAESEQIRLLGGIHAAKGPATGKDTAPGSWSTALLKACLSLGLRWRAQALVDAHHSDQRMPCTACNHAHRPSRQVLAGPPSRDLTRHGCRVRAYMDVLAACPAMVGGQGPRSHPADHPNKMHRALLAPCTPTIPTGPCPPTVAEPYAEWMPRKSLQGRTCGVSCEGGRARAPQPSGRSAALQLIHRRRPVLSSTTPKAIS